VDCSNCGESDVLGPHCPACGAFVADDVSGPLPESDNRHSGPPDGWDTADNRGETSAGPDPRTRRRALAGAGGVLGLLVAGAYIFDRPRQEGPAETVKAWREAWAQGDAETYKRLWHPDRPESERTLGLERLDFGAEAPPNYVQENAETVTRTDTEAVVREQFVAGTGLESLRRVAVRVELRTVGNDWRVWDVQTEFTEPVEECRRRPTLVGLSGLECE